MAEMIVTFREVLEAALVVGVISSVLVRSGRRAMLTSLWQGVVLALLVSAGAALATGYIADGFTGSTAKIFEGVVTIVAGLVLGSMIIWMARNRHVVEKVESQVKTTLTGSTAAKWGIFSLGFCAVLREGIETVLFLYGIVTKQGGLSALAAFCGAIAALALAYTIFVQGRRIPLRMLFSVSSCILICVAAGMMAYGVHELESSGIIPDTGRIWNINPAPKADGSYPLFHDKGAVGGVGKALFGYNGDPSYLEVSVWMFTFLGLLLTWRRVSAVRTVS